MIYSINNIREKVAPVCEQWQIGKLLLFGSYAKGEATENSDLDFIVFDTNKSLLGSKFYALVGELRDVFNPINVEVLEDAEQNNIPWINDILASEGVVIYESGSNTGVEN